MSGAYKVTHYYGVHQGGTKDFHIYVITGPNEKHGLVIRRFGKTSTDGQSKVDVVNSHAATKTMLDKLLKERAKNGYDMRFNAQTSGNFDTANEALSVMPVRHQSNLAQFYVEKLTAEPSSSVTGTYDPLANERANVLQEALADRLARESAEEAEALKSNPMFGMF
jgi:predicted DNA-binding WGR domain protein